MDTHANILDHGCTPIPLYSIVSDSASIWFQVIHSLRNLLSDTYTTVFEYAHNQVIIPFVVDQWCVAAIS